MAEIEVLLDFGRPYVRLDDYNEMKERYWSQVTKTQDADGEAAKWQEHARAALARVAELEAQLAAQGWRPVTEEWPPYGVQHLGRGLLNSPTLLITRTVNEGNEVWQDSDGLLFYAGAIRYCAAIPAPQETE